MMNPVQTATAANILPLLPLWNPVVTVHVLREDIKTLLRFADLPTEMEERLEPEMDGASRFASFALDVDELACLMDECKRFSIRLYAGEEGE